MKYIQPKTDTLSIHVTTICAASGSHYDLTITGGEGYQNPLYAL